MEGIAELKELDRIIQEHAAIKNDYDELLKDKERLERGLQKREHKEPYLEEVIKERDRLRDILYKTTQEERVTIGKTELETIIKQHFNYAEVKIEKVCAGSNIATYVYPPAHNMPLLFKMDLLFLKSKRKK